MLVGLYARTVYACTCNKGKKNCDKKKYCFVAHASNAMNNKLVFILFLHTQQN